MALAAVLTFSRALTAPVGRDEHQFFTGAWAMRSQPLAFYSDIPFFHLPGHLAILSPVFGFEYPFLLARLVNGLIALAALALLGAIARAIATQRGAGALLSEFIGAGVIVLGASSKLYGLAASHVWNHSSSVLFLLISLLCAKKIEPMPAIRWDWLCGFALGAAVACRVSAATVVPVALFMVFQNARGTRRTKLLAIGSATVAFALVMLPGGLYLLRSPESTWFGVVEYARLNTQYRGLMGFSTGMSLKDKLWVAWGALETWHQRSVLVLWIGAAALCVASLVRGSRPLEPASWLALAVFACGGSLLPTPAWPQYFIVSHVFMLLSLPVLASCFRSQTGRRLAATAIVLLAVASMFDRLGRGGVEQIRKLGDPWSWTPLVVHAVAGRISSAVESRGGAGRVLTLSPLYVSEAGLPVEPALVTGPFAWRISPLVEDERARLLKLPVWADVLAGIHGRQWPALLTGSEESVLEEPLADAAIQAGYEPVRVGATLTLWLQPEAD